MTNKKKGNRSFQKPLALALTVSMFSQTLAALPAWAEDVSGCMDAKLDSLSQKAKESFRAHEDLPAPKQRFCMKDGKKVEQRVTFFVTDGKLQRKLEYRDAPKTSTTTTTTTTTTSSHKSTQLREAEIAAERARIDAQNARDRANLIAERERIAREEEALKKEKDKNDHTVRNIAIGAGAVAVGVGGVMWAKRNAKKAAEKAAEDARRSTLAQVDRENEIRREAFKAGQKDNAGGKVAAELKDTPHSIDLKSLQGLPPHLQDGSARVAGRVPADMIDPSIPRYYGPGGVTYVMQPNSMGLFEFMILDSMLHHPVFYPYSGFYGSPFVPVPVEMHGLSTSHFAQTSVSDIERVTTETTVTTINGGFQNAKNFGETRINTINNGGSRNIGETRVNTINDGGFQSAAVNNNSRKRGSDFYEAPSSNSGGWTSSESSSSSGSSSSNWSSSSSSSSSNWGSSSSSSSSSSNWGGGSSSSNSSFLGVGVLTGGGLGAEIGNSGDSK